MNSPIAHPPEINPLLPKGQEAPAVTAGELQTRSGPGAIVTQDTVVDAQKAQEQVREAQGIFTKAWGAEDGPAGILCKFAVLADSNPMFEKFHAEFMKRGFSLSGIEALSSPAKKELDTRGIFQYRAALIKELQIEKTVEFMFLDAALVAWSQAGYFDFLVAQLGNKAGTKGFEFNEHNLRMSARLTDLAMKYRCEFRAMMKLLLDFKSPPFVVKIQNAEKVGIQVNPQPPSKDPS